MMKICSDHRAITGATIKTYRRDSLESDPREVGVRSDDVMKAVVLEAPRKINLSIWPTPERRGTDVLIAPKTVGICGTDVSVYNGSLPVRYPLILGHEYCAEIVEAGSNVYGLKEKDVVIGEASWGCRSCYFCFHSEPHYCENKRQLGRTVNGVLSEFATVPDSTLHKLPEAISVEEAQSIVTISTGLRAIRRGKVGVGDRLLILGCGHAGLILTQLCRLAGASLIVVTGTRIDRLKKAKELGADSTVLTTETSWEDKVKKMFADVGADVVVDAAGRRDSLNQGLRFVKKGGTLIEFGTYTHKQDGFDAPQIYKKEVTIVGSMGGSLEYEKAIELLGKRKVNISTLVSHRVPLTKAEEMFSMISEGKTNILRAVIEISK